jgi:TolB-like protein/DNA-binding winged helix-turn-helix (wHTH) protein/tetratricopeptide (TPR) repeat protein
LARVAPGEGEYVRFNSFALCSETGELFKDGIPLKLSPQPFRLLRLLVSRPGELVSREEIQQALWADGTTVEFDQGLNFCIRQIRAALNDDAREPRFIETLPKRGYRFIAPIEVEPSAAEPRVAAPRPWKRLRWWLAGAAATAIVGLILAIPPNEFRAGPQAILVRPLVNLGLPAEEAWLADALTQELVAALAETKSLRVIPWSSSIALKGQNLGARDLGVRFHVNAILEGSIRRSGDRLQVTMQLVDAASDGTLWTYKDERDARELGKIQDDLLTGIADTLKLRITEETTPSTRRRPPDLETYNLYLKAQYLADQFSAEGVAQSIDDFEEVVHKAPGYAPSYAGLANALTILPFFQSTPPRETLARARSAAQQAIQLDAGLAVAHAALAHAFFMEWEWQPAGKEFLTALGLDPNSAMARQLQALFLASQGRADEAIREAKHAEALAPTSGLIAFSLSQVFLQTSHFDEAIEQSRRTLQLYPHFPEAYNALARAYTLKGMTKQALETLQEWSRYETSREQPLWRANTLARAGKKEEARRLIRDWRQSNSRGENVPMAYVAAVLACGESDEALAALHRSVARHAPSMIWLKSTPELAEIRSDRRFVEVLSEMKLD